MREPRCCPVDVAREHRSEARQQHSLMTDVDPALEERVSDVPQRERKAHVHHHHEADPLRQRIEVAQWASGLASAASRPVEPHALTAGVLSLTEPSIAIRVQHR